MKKAIRIGGMVLTDAVLINLSYLIAFLLRFDFAVKSHGGGELFALFGKWWLLLTGIKLVIFVAVGMYTSLWRFAGGGEFLRVAGGILLGNLAAGAFLLIIGSRFPVGMLVLVMLMDLLLIAASRGIYYYLANYRFRRTQPEGEDLGGRRAMIVGADHTSRDLIREMRMKRSKTVFIPTVIVGGDRDVTGTRLEGLKVSGTRKEITKLVRRNKITDIFITLPSGELEELKEVRKECAKTSCKVWELPGLDEYLDGFVRTKRRGVSLQDAEALLDSPKVYVNRRQLDACFRGRIVLITGAGTDLGRELCRQTGAYSPKAIVAVGTSERELLMVQEEMKKDYPEVEVRIALASVNDPERVSEVFDKYTPHVVLHSAFYRTDLAEKENLREMISTNVFGTANVLRACEAAKAERFIMISSDRAGDREDVLGASLRAAEILVQRCRSSKVLYSCVRVGDTVFDEDSGIREMIRQIEAGGPVWLESEEKTRAFSPLGDSLKLAMQAAAMAAGSEVFGMKAGREVVLKDLAEGLITRCGLTPGAQIPIGFTGGEEETEDRDRPEEGRARETENSLLVILEEDLREDSAQIMDFEALKEVLDRESEEDLRAELKELVR